MKRILILLLSMLAIAQHTAFAQPCAAPTVSSFAPNTGFIGSLVTINGSNFSPVPSDNQVFFGATQAQVISASFGRLEAQVPVGTTYAPITVRNSCGLIGVSALYFNGIFCGTAINSGSYNTVSYSTNVSGGYQMLSQDMDQDGKPDLLVCGFTTNSVSVMRNVSTPGTFNFAPKHDLAFSGLTRCIAPADYDGDGKTDLAVVDNGINGIRLFKNNSVPGTLGFAASIAIAANSSYQVAAGDLNGDGKMDLACTSFSGGIVMTFLNTTPVGGPISFAAGPVINNVFMATGIAIADVDGDGIKDIGTSCPSNNLVTAIRNTTPVGSSALAFGSAQSFATGSSYPYRLFVGDFDKDGRIDFAANNHSGATTSVFRNTSSPASISFAPVVNLASPTSNYRLGVGDADGDGKPDLVTKSAGVNVFSVYINTSSGPGDVSFALRVDYPGQAEVSGILIADLDGDNVPDISTSGTNFNTLRIHRNNSSVVDITEPVAVCKNINVALDPSGNGIITPQMVDNGSSDACGIQSMTIDKTNFTCSDLGPNTVVLTVTDRAGNVATCTAIVTIAPAEIEVAGQTTVCQGQSIPMTANLGDSFQWYKDGVAIADATSQLFTATVSGAYTVEVANSGGCSGISAPLNVVVNNNPTVSTSPSGTAMLCPPPMGSVIITASQSSTYQWLLNGNNIAGATGQSYTALTLGSYQVKVIDLFGCSATSDPVIISGDVTPPVITNLPANITVPNDMGTCEAAVSWIEPGVTDNCTGATLAITSPEGTENGFPFPLGTTTVTYTATDASGNTAAGSFTVTVEDKEGPRTDFTLMPIVEECSVTIRESDFPFTQDMCEPGRITATTTDPLTYTTLGEHTITWIFTDSKGNSSSVEQSIFLRDTSPPVIVGLPANIFKNNDAGVCGAVVSWIAPTTTDNCSATIVQTAGPVSGSLFPWVDETTTITYTATDAGGNSVQASFTVSVLDTEPPVFTNLPANIVVPTDAGMCEAIVTWPEPVLADNCSGRLRFIQEGGRDNGTPFPVGTTTVRYLATDASANTTIASFNVTVEDKEAPLAEAVLIPLEGEGSVTVTQIPTARDICDGWITATTLNPLTYTTVGEHTITWTYTDSKGNASSQQQLVIVKALVPVYVTSPADNAINTNVSLTVSSRSLTGATTYNIELCALNNFSSGVIVKSGSRSQSFSGLAYNTKYFARVKTNLAPGYGKVTNFTTKPSEFDAYVTSPKNLAINTAVSLNVTSNIVTGALAYTIELSPDNTFTGGVITNAAITTTRSQRFSGLAYGTTYYARVKTNLSPNYGRVSSFTTVSVASLCYVTNPSNGASNVSWNPTLTVNNIGTGTYTVQLSTSQNFSTVAAQQSGTGTLFNFTGLGYNTLYYNRVSSSLAPGEWGIVRSFGTTTPESLSYITSPANGATNVSYEVNVTAFVVPDATLYTIELNDAADFTGTGQTKTGSRTLGFALSYNTRYYARVKTNLKDAWGTTIRSFTTGSPLSLAFVTSPVNGGAGVPTSVNITSNRVPNATSYTIQINTMSNFSGTGFVLTGPTRTIAFSGLANTTTYYTRVRTNLEGGAWGTTVTNFTTVNPAARTGGDWVGKTEDEAIEFGSAITDVYPNPFREQLNIHQQTDVQERMLLVLFDLTGRETLRQESVTNKTTQVETGELASGIYLLKITTPQGVTVKKVMRD